MSQSTAICLAPTPPPATRSRGLIRWICTSNPFYALSAALFLVGLWMSFGGQDQAVQAWGLMSGLSGYTLLLAVTAWLLVRFGNVWDDVRTVLLLVVLMFLATSVTFDEILVGTAELGLACYLVGLLFAVGLSEGLLRGIRLSLPPLFRVPYHLTLCLFYLYPLILRPHIGNPNGETLQWGLFGFSTAAGLVCLTLLPAARRGPDYVNENGSPWQWPLYPWALFAILALAVPARAFLLCWSMHLLVGSARESLIFGAYFLVPFGLAVAVLLFELGVARRSTAALVAALAMPVVLVGLAVAGHRDDAVYQGFLHTFAVRMGGDPLFMTTLLAIGFYCYALLRGVGAATELLTVALACVAFVGPDSLRSGLLHEPAPLPFLLLAAFQFAFALWRGSSWRWLIGGAALLAASVLLLPEGLERSPLREAIAFHLALLGVMVLGAKFIDGLGVAMRVPAAAMVLVGCVMVLRAQPAGVPRWMLALYPLALAMVLGAYGLYLRHRISIAVAAMLLTEWGGVAGISGYARLREWVPGIDHLVLSFALLGVAVLVSLAKSGLPARWLAAWHGRPAFLDAWAAIPAVVEAEPSSTFVQPPPGLVGEGPPAE